MTVDDAIAAIPEGWSLTLDRYVMELHFPEEPSAHTWRVWLKRLEGDVEGDGACYLHKVFATGQTPVDAITAATAKIKLIKRVSFDKRP